MMNEVPIKTLRLFGVDIPIYRHHISDQYHPPPPHQGIMAVAHNAENPDAHQQQVVVVEEAEEEEEEEEQDNMNPVVLFRKRLTASDVLPGQGRLRITGSERLMEALTEEERAKVESGTHVTVVTTTEGNGDDGGAEYTMRLTKWCSRALVLIHEWNDLVNNNRLEAGDSVQARGYRLRGHFRLLLRIIYRN